VTFFLVSKLEHLKIHTMADRFLRKLDDFELSLAEKIKELARERAEVRKLRRAYMREKERKEFRRKKPPSQAEQILDVLKSSELIGSVPIKGRGLLKKEVMAELRKRDISIPANQVSSCLNRLKKRNLVKRLPDKFWRVSPDY
jgi:hypothetical protein